MLNSFSVHIDNWWFVAQLIVQLCRMNLSSKFLELLNKDFNLHLILKFMHAFIVWLPQNSTLDMSNKILFRIPKASLCWQASGYHESPEFLTGKIWIRKTGISQNTLTCPNGYNDLYCGILTYAPVVATYQRWYSNSDGESK